MTAAGAVTGGVVGAFFDVVLGGVVGVALGTFAGHLLGEWVAWSSDQDPNTRAKLAPRLVGSIPTDTSRFVGRASVLGSLEQFLQREASGVFTLYGLGGCGKSAVLKQFLETAGLLDTPSRHSPDAVFVWSFHDVTDVVNFFAALTDYLKPLFPSSDVAQEADSIWSDPLLLSDNLHRLDKQIVVVLDGLERVQEVRDDGFAALGVVPNPALRSLLQRASEGRCGLTKIVITSRLLVPGLNEEDGESVFVADLNQLDLPDAIELLRASNVRGTDPQLAAAAEEYDRHAYSIALLARAIAKHLHRDVRRRDRSGVRASGDSPIGRILEWYRDLLNPGHLAVMQAVSAFRGPVRASDIESIALTIQPSIPVTSTAVHSIQADLADLRDLGLLFADDASFQSDTTYDLHPLIRDFFYSLLLDPTAAHDKAWALFSARQPGVRPTTASEIQTLVELIYHALRSGRSDEAWQIYRDRLGGYTYLGTQRADHPTGAEVIRDFLDSDVISTAALGTERLARLYVDGALYLKNEGRLDDARDLLISADGQLHQFRTQSVEYLSILLNLSGIELLRGRVHDAVASARRASDVLEVLQIEMEPTAEARLRKECISRQAAAVAVTGDPHALELFQSAAVIPDSAEQAPREYAAIRHAWLLSLLGRHGEARQVLLASLPLAEKLDATMIVQRMQAQRALVEMRAGEFAVASELVDVVSRAATRADLHLFVQSWLVRGALAVSMKRWSEARHLLAEGLRHAGDNGFALEWIDQQVLSAQASLAAGDANAAIHHAEAALEGSVDDYLCEIPGATATTVRYAWAEVPARYILGQALSQDSRHAAKAAEQLRLARDLIAHIGHPPMDGTGR